MFSDRLTLRAARRVFAFESDKIQARLRIGFTVLFQIYFLFLYMYDGVTFKTVCIVSAFLVMCMFLSFFYYWERRPVILYRTLPFIGAFFDITLLTIGSAYLYYDDKNSVPFNIVACAVYFWIIFLSSAHNRRGITIFSGLYSVVAYVTLLLWTVMGEHGGLNLFTHYFPSIATIFLAAMGAILITEHNHILISKIVQTEGRYFNLGRSLPILFFKMSHEGKIVWVDRTIRNKFSALKKRFVGVYIHDIISDSKFTFRGDELKGTFAVTHFDPIEYVDCMIHKPTKRSRYFEGVLVDATEKVRALHEREAMEDKLFQYKKMESLGNLASGIAHDFNNILQEISSITDSIKRDTQEEKTRKGIEVIGETLFDAGFLISELLSLGSKKKMNLQDVDLRKFLTTILEYYRKKETFTCDFILQFPTENILIYADTGYLKRVFHNLINNALDVLPERGVVTLIVHRCRSGSVAVDVVDNGGGIPLEIQENIFDPFYSTKKKSKGTGLGLAMVKQVVSLHHGTVTLKKTDSSGTIFTVELPCHGENFEHLSPKQKIVNRMNGAVFVLEDDPKIGQIVEFFLKEFKYTVNLTEDIPQLLTILEKSIPDVLLVDWTVHDYNPLEMIKKIRFAVPQVPIIVTSGYLPDEEAMEKYSLSSWLTKPYDKHHLDREIQGLLHKQLTR